MNTLADSVKKVLGLSNIGGVKSRVTKDIGAAGFNDAFHKSPKGIIYRYCPKCAPSHQHIYYRRFGDFKKFDPYLYMACDWSDKNNKMGTNFKLYSFYSDALAGKPDQPGSKKKSSDVGEWKYCNSGSSKKYTMGAFHDCGPSTKTGGQWSVMIGAAKGMCGKDISHKGMQVPTRAKFRLNLQDCCNSQLSQTFLLICST